MLSCFILILSFWCFSRLVVWHIRCAHCVCMWTYVYLCVSKIVFQRTEGAYRHSGSCCLIRAEQFPESGRTFLPGLTPTWSKHKYFSYSTEKNWGLKRFPELCCPSGSFIAVVETMLVFLCHYVNNRTFWVKEQCFWLHVKTRWILLL